MIAPPAPRQLPFGVISSPRRPAGIRAWPPATSCARRPVWPSAPRARQHRVDHDVDGLLAPLRAKRGGALLALESPAPDVSEVDAPRLHQSEQLGRVDRRRPEGHALHLGRQAQERRPVAPGEPIAAEARDDRRIERAPGVPEGPGHAWRGSAGGDRKRPLDGFGRGLLVCGADAALRLGEPSPHGDGEAPVGSCSADGGQVRAGGRGEDRHEVAVQIDGASDVGDATRGPRPRCARARARARPWPALASPAAAARCG